MSEPVRILTARRQSAGETEPARATPPRAAPARAGIIVNGRSHRNRASGARGDAPDGVLTARPTSPDDLRAALSEFAERGVDLLVIDGGDGTIRDVLTAAGRIFQGGLPRLAVLPSGKTNALALDLGVPLDWTLEDALHCAEQGRFRRRSPLEIWRPGGEAPELQGFLFGTAAFVRATVAAQKAHRLGAFDTVAVGVTLAGSVVRTLFGGPRDGWRAGEATGLALDEGPLDARPRFLVMGSTLERLPLGVQPFGPPRPGLKLISVDAPPKRLTAALPQILSGGDAPWLAKSGYLRTEAETVSLALVPDFVLDGEIYPGGEFVVRRGTPLEFAAP